MVGVQRPPRRKAGLSDLATGFKVPKALLCTGQARFCRCSVGLLVGCFPKLYKLYALALGHARRSLSVQGLGLGFRVQCSGLKDVLHLKPFFMPSAPIFVIRRPGLHKLGER